MMWVHMEVYRATTKELENDLANMSLVCGIGDLRWI